MERIGGKRREETKREDKRRGEKKREEKSREEERIKSGNAVWLQSSCVAYAIYLCSLSQGFLLLLPKTASSIWLALKVSHHCSEMFPNGLEIQEFLIDIVFNSNETSRNRAKSAPPRLHPSQPRDVANIAILDKTEEIYIITPQSYDSEDYRHTDDEEWRVLSRIRQRWRQKGRAFPLSKDSAINTSMYKLIQCWPQAYRPPFQEMIHQVREDLTKGDFTETLQQNLVPMLATTLGSLTLQDALHVVKKSLIYQNCVVDQRT